MGMEWRGTVGTRLGFLLGLEGMGAYGPLLLAPAEGLRGPSGPLTCGVINFNNY